MPRIFVHEDDLPEDLEFPDGVAIDTESMGLDPVRDRLCLVQVSSGDDTAHLVRIQSGSVRAPRLVRLLEDPQCLKILHFARADMSMLKVHLDAWCAPVYCTKIASRLARTYTDRHGLKDLSKELLDLDLSKQSQQSDWGQAELSQRQLKYAASDVLYLHRLKAILDAMLVRENRQELAEACFSFLPDRVKLDLRGWKNLDIFAH